MFLKLATCGWIRSHRHVILYGPTGVGKIWSACVLGNAACREDISVLYHRVPRLLASLDLARGDGRCATLLTVEPRETAGIATIASANLPWGNPALDDNQISAR